MKDMMFDVPRNKTRLETVKERHRIETRDCKLRPGDLPWVAVHRPSAEEALRGHGVTKDTTLYDMFADYCRLMDGLGLIAYGETEEEAVLNLCRLNGIEVVL